LKDQINIIVQQLELELSFGWPLKKAYNYLMRHYGFFNVVSSVNIIEFRRWYLIFILLLIFITWQIFFVLYLIVLIIAFINLLKLFIVNRSIFILFFLIVYQIVNNRFIIKIIKLILGFTEIKMKKFQDNRGPIILLLDSEWQILRKTCATTYFLINFIQLIKLFNSRYLKLICTMFV